MPKTDFEHRENLLPHHSEFKSKYSIFLNKELPLAMFDDSFSIIIAYKQIGLCAAAFLEMAMREPELRDLAEWIIYARIKTELFLTRSFKGRERKMQSFKTAVQQAVEKEIGYGAIKKQAEEEVNPEISYD
ncbi:MAG: hypothetical protein QXD48_03855 [Candidatus Aenigmatarchaeota archaeon]